MTKKHFTFKEAFTFGWLKTKQHAWFSACSALIGFILMSSVRHVPPLEMLVAALVGLSIVSISLTIARDHSFTFADLYKPVLSPKLTLKFLVLLALYTSLVSVFFVPIVILFSITALKGVSVITNNIPLFVSFVVLTLPSLYIAVRFKMFPYVVVDNEHASLKDLIKMTYKLTQHHFWMVLGFLVALSVFNALGVAFFFFGIFITAPISIFATAHVYDKLKTHNM